MRGVSIVQTDWLRLLVQLPAVEAMYHMGGAGPAPRIRLIGRRQSMDLDIAGLEGLASPDPLLRHVQRVLAA